VFEIGGVTRGQHGASGPGDGGDLTVCLADWASKLPARGSNFGEFRRGGAIKWQNLSVESDFECFLRYSFQILAPFPRREPLESPENLGLGYCGYIELSSGA